MKDEATPEQIAMADKIADQMYPRTHPGWIGGQACALMAVREVTELIAAFIEREIPFENDGKVVGRCSGDMATAKAIRSGAHLKGLDHG